MSSAAARLSGTCGGVSGPRSGVTGGQAGGSGAADCGWTGGSGTAAGETGRPVPYGGPDGTGGAETGGTGGAETGGTNGVRPWLSGLDGSWRGMVAPKPPGSVS